DPLTAFPQRLREARLLSAETLEALRAGAESLVSEALARCTEVVEGKRVIPAALWPAPETATEGLRGPDPQGVRYVEREDIALRPMTLVEGISLAIRRAMERDPRVIVLGEEVANLRGGAYGATRAVVEDFRSRLFNTPISETGFCGMAGGAAAVGMRPIVEVMYPDFALMASDQLFNQIGKLRHMYGGKAR
ncbi:MAG: MFS transporter, partial [Chloroflexi bacterium]|nr:MFS transporter [Chloroflexota bacterium]